ncbi:hypothetical protein DFH27DRAFT_396303 [Peziza echinospora]|nr:hypothetical protein DFH27DRAFT_396303 [Peziza echinospora]
MGKQQLSRASRIERIVLKKVKSWEGGRGVRLRGKRIEMGKEWVMMGYSDAFVRMRTEKSAVRLLCSRTWSGVEERKKEDGIRWLEKGFLYLILRLGLEQVSRFFMQWGVTALTLNSLQEIGLVSHRNCLINENISLVAPRILSHRLVVKQLFLEAGFVQSRIQGPSVYFMIPEHCPRTLRVRKERHPKWIKDLVWLSLGQTFMTFSFQTARS